MVRSSTLVPKIAQAFVGLKLSLLRANFSLELRPARLHLAAEDRALELFLLRTIFTSPYLRRRISSQNFGPP
ncbi:hypothetical protein FRC06_003776 [Ceratobasidium sp. 370]|nr:hypothetical protein FRC06_003776 [Ceratobasidium sp. 370]